MDAIVINLDSATQRMSFQEQQLNKYEIKFQRLSATFLKDINDPTYKKYALNWERTLRPAEIAAFLSHKEAWEIVSSQQHPMLILEDDACFADNINCILEGLDNKKNIDYVNIEVTGINKKKLLAKKVTSTFCGTRLIRLYQGRSGAGGYVLWPSGAKKLLKQARNNNIGLADKFINANYSLLSYQIEPAVLIQLDQCIYHGIEAPIEVVSSITPPSTMKMKLESCRICRFRRFMAQVVVGLNHLHHIHHASKRSIAFSDRLFKLSSYTSR